MEWYSWALVVCVTITLMVAIGVALRGGEPPAESSKEEPGCNKGVAACLCDQCREGYIASRLKQVEAEIQERDRKNFLAEVDKSIEEMREKHGLSKPVSPPPHRHADMDFYKLKQLVYYDHTIDQDTWDDMSMQKRDAFLRSLRRKASGW